MKDLNSNYLYSVEGLNCVALGRWSNDVELLVNNLDTFSIDNQKRRFAGCIFDISDPIEIDAYNTKIWLIQGTNPESRESPDPNGKIRILPRANEGMMVEFWHDTADDNFLASYEYIRQLCKHLRIYGMVFESDIPSQVELGLETISTSFFLRSKFQNAKLCLLSTKAPPAFLLPRGSVEAGPIRLKREKKASCELTVDGFYSTPKWAKPDESIQYIQNGIISILISDYDPHTKIEITCRHEAFLPFVIKLLRALKELPDEDVQVIQREIDHLMFVDTYTDVEETAVSQPKEDQKDSNRKVIEFLYWLSRSCQFDTNRPADLGWANEQFQLNWEPKEGGDRFPDHLHSDIPEILHNLMESTFLADHPQNFPDAKTTGRFEEMENRNGERISKYPPFGFQIYVTSYGLKYIERELRKGELGKKRNQNGDIDWNSNIIETSQGSTGKTTSKPHPGTVRKINSLIAYREKELKDRNQIPSWTSACNDIINIEPRTVKKYCLELAERWDEKEFRPEKWEFRE